MLILRSEGLVISCKNVFLKDYSKDWSGCGLEVLLSTYDLKVLDFALRRELNIFTQAEYVSNVTSWVVKIGDLVLSDKDVKQEVLCVRYAL